MHLTRSALVFLFSATLLGATACSSAPSTGTTGTGGASPTTSTTTTAASASGTGGVNFTTSSATGSGGAGTGGMTSSSGSGGATGTGGTGTGGMTSSSGAGGATSSSGATSASSSSSSTSSASSASAGASSSSSSGGMVCLTPASCPPPVNECVIATCTAGVCGTSFAAAGTPTSMQTAGDCHKNECDGAGNITSVVDDSDLPVDGNVCTNDLCTNGVPSNPAKPAGATCGMNLTCNAGGVCGGCAVASDCPGMDTPCRQRACVANACVPTFTPAGMPVGTQVPGDCHTSECDGMGNPVNVVDNADVPVDGKQCTGDLCTAGVPSNPPAPLGTACNQGGGTACDGMGACVMGGGPDVASTTPADASTGAAFTPIAVTFTTAMNPGTLTGQTTAGACAGSIQVSLDGFATCVAFSSTLPVMSGANTTATLTPAPGLLVNRVYKIRVTTAARSAGNVMLAAQYTQPAGFTTTSPDLCNGSVVISQIYSSGGNNGAVYKNDFVELHNRGATPVSLSGKSLQYSASMSNIWTANPVLLTGTLPPGGYLLVQLAGGTTGAALPTPDISSAAINLGASAGKVALVNGTTSIGMASICPPAATTLDFVAYGTTNCASGAAATAPATATAPTRVQSGCGNTDDNLADFPAVAPAPRNSATAPSACACLAENESNAVLEADFCDTQFPLSLTTKTGTMTMTVYGRIYEMGVTEAAGPNATVRAQLGFGPTTANPEYQPGWTWVNASYNVQSGNDDEYQASFTAPAVGTYNYVYRFSLDQGVSWTYCDNAQGDGGSGSNAGLTFDLQDEGIFTVTP